jgi:DNA-binding response OmpR family regulator
MQPVGALILVVDDDVHVQRAVKRAAEAAGYQVVQALDGATVLALATAMNFDLILLDLALPKIDGRDVLNLLKHNPSTADVPVLLYSGSGSDPQNDRRQGYDLGAVDFIQKPFNSDMLLKKIGRLIEKARERAAQS